MATAHGSTIQRTGQVQATDRGLGGLAARFRDGRKSGFGIFHPGSWLMMIGGMMMIFSAFMPWVYVSMTHEIIGEAFVLRGTDGPGVVTLALGFLAFAGAFVPKRKLVIPHAAVPAILVAMICLLQCWNIIAASIDTQWGSFMPGMGIVLAGAGAALLAKAAWKTWKHWPVPAR